MGVFKDGYFVRQLETGEKFAFGVTGFSLPVFRGQDWQVNGRLLGSNTISRYNADGDHNMHYFYGLGAQGRYRFLNFLYCDLTLDCVYYNIKTPIRTVDMWVFDVSAPDGGGGLIGSLGLGADLMIAENLYLYAGKYITAGKIGVFHKTIVDYGSSIADIMNSVLDFSHSDNYRFGMNVFF